MNKSDTAPCRYHQRNPGKWHCRDCDLALCGDCKPMADRLPDDVPCPLCRTPMADLDAGPPFWQHWREILRYGLERTVLIFIGVIGLVQLITPAGLTTLLAGLPVLILFLYYMAVIIDRSACGSISPPVMAELTDRTRIDARMEWVKAGLVYALALLAAGLIGSPLVLGMVVLLAAMAFPASVMAVTIDEQYRAAFDYRRLTTIARRLGMDYNLLAAATLAVAAIPVLVFYLPGLILPTFIHATLLTLVYGWAGLSLSHAIAGVLYQYRRKLEFGAGMDPIDRPLPPKPAVYEPVQALADARVQMAEDQLDHARVTIGEAMTRYPRNRELNRRFEELLAANGQISALKNHVERVLHRKVSDGDVTGAVDHWLHHRDSLEGWEPKISATRHRMAMELEKRGDPRTAVRLLLALPKMDPRYGRLPEACLDAARMLEEHFADHAKAEPLRKFVQTRYPGRAASWYEKYQLVDKNLQEHTKPIG